LEGFMWDKETEVDRFRERVPLSNLASQCRASLADPSAPKPRDWIGPVKQMARAAANGGNGSFVIVPECKRSDPASGTLRRRYDLSKLVREFTVAGAPSISVNCDAILFGGTLDHITEARLASSQAAVERMSQDGVIVPPILASDLILYPYQLYKLRLAGADAVNLIVGALASMDVLYLTKIAASLQLQALVTVTSIVQIDRVTQAVKAGSLDGIILSNRILEDFSFDETGEQVLSMLKSAELQALKEKHGADILVLAEGRIGLIERMEDQGELSTTQYLKELKAAGALGAIVGGGLVTSASGGLDAMQTLQELQNAI
jgi:indole-3-glycerol phosphate synthase